MDTRVVTPVAPNPETRPSKKWDVLAPFSARALAPQQHDEADELARSMHAVIALLDGHRH